MRDKSERQLSDLVTSTTQKTSLIDELKTDERNFLLSAVGDSSRDEFSIASKNKPDKFGAFRAVDCLEAFENAKAENFKGSYSRQEQMMIVRAMYSPMRTYFIVALNSDGSGLVKIGKAKDVPKRFSAISMSSPVPVELRAVVPFTDALAGVLQNYFTKHRSHGDWFRYCDDLVGVVMLARDMRPSQFLGLLHDHKVLSDDIFNERY